MADRIIDDAILIDIGDSIRAKTGNIDRIPPENMSYEIDHLSAEEIIGHASVSDYVKDEALRVANLVQAARKSDSIVFLAMSDSHHCGEQSDTSWQTNTNIGNLDACMAAKVLAYVLKLDFVCHLGDLTFGHDTTTSELLHQQIDEMCLYLDDAQKDIPAFWTVGNHDTGMYAVDNGTETELESADYLFDIFGKRCEGAVYGSTEYGYCYRDFVYKKFRVICLNSSELDTVTGYGTSPSMSQEQLKWFAQTLYDVGAKDGWSVLVLSHYPLDFYNAYPASDVVKAYVEGTSITVGGTTVNFSGRNKAKFVANFHGHTHCFKTAKLNKVDHSASSATEYNAWRVAIPNSAFYRNNHQPETDAHGISFKDDQTWDKTIGGAKDTAFVVTVINPSDEVIKSYTYGAGPEERIVGYGDIAYHKITRSISGATINNVTSSIEHNTGYTATITPNEHCRIASVTITMGGVDVTSSVYSGGRITIPAVTGDVIITVKAALALACTNQIPISTDENGAVFNQVGWQKGYRLSSSGTVGSHSSSYVTGFIPVKYNDTVRLDNVHYENVASGALSTADQRICFYDSSKQFLGMVNSTATALQDRVFDENKHLIEFTVENCGSGQYAIDITNVAYFRLNAAYIGDDSVITVNEEIKYLDEVENNVAVINNLTYTNNSNKASSVVKGSSYTANITTPSGYILQSVKVTMGGIDITSTAYSNGVINIGSATGDIVITAVGVSDGTTSYTNQIHIATDADGTIYNGTGYKANTYLSSGTATSTTDTIYTTGFIPCKIGDKLYCKNVGMQASQDKHRLCFYDENKQYLSLVKTTAAYNGFNYGEDGNIDILQISSSGNNSATAYIRLCCSYIGPDSVITVGQPIT